MTSAVLVNGPPASGKSTVARALGVRLDLPVLALDAVKEVLFDELGHRDADREWGRTLGRISLEAIWSLLSGFPMGSSVIVDAWLRLPPHDAVIAGLERAGVRSWVEVWCHAPAEVLVARYSARERHPGHPAAEDYVDELRSLVAVAVPVDRSPCLELDTSDLPSLDLEAVARWVAERLDGA
jgi:glucokinase